MDILISHWHCIIPAVAILLALVLLQGKDTGKTKKNKENIYEGDDHNEEG